jgi:3-oxoacyl-[acyl-carrier-protein] synthase I
VTTGNAAVVTAIGMATPVGLTAAQSCAAVRAGISAMADLDYFVLLKGDFPAGPARGGAVRSVTDGYFGLGRWTRLATRALADLVQTSRLSGADLASSALYLALPPLTREGVDPRIGELLPVRIGEWMDAPGIERRTRVFSDGHASGARAIQSAVADVLAGAAQRAIVCGVDSLIEPDSLQFLMDKRRLKAPDREGLIPGEAAAALLIETSLAASARGARPLAGLAAASVAVEPTPIWSSEPSAAVGLSTCAQEALGQMPDRGRGIRLLISDVNGEQYRAKELANTMARVLSTVRTDWVIWHHADCMGDTGSAAFTVSACLGAQALAKGYAKSDAVLLLGSSDDGLRGAVSLGNVSREAQP